MSPRPRAGGAGRVIAGTAKGRQLLPAGTGTRPLGDRLKEALFAILEPELRDRAFLDLLSRPLSEGLDVSQEFGHRTNVPTFGVVTPRR